MPEGSRRPELWLEPAGRWAAVERRVRVAMRSRIERVRWSRQTDRAPSRGADAGPRFPLSSYDAPFTELEAIVAHPAVAAAIAEPAAPVSSIAPPDPRLPAGADRFGAPRRRPAPIFDLVPFGIEADVLELRLLEYQDLVEKFIVVEAPRSFGGLTKPLYFASQAARFERFRDRIVHIVLPPEVTDPLFANRRRGPTTFRGEDAFRAAMWRAAREHVVFPEDAGVLYADADEFPSRAVLQWVREREVPMPFRLNLSTLRYSLRWLDRDTPAQCVFMSPRQFADADRAPERLRHLPGPVFGARGAVHLTSFLPPLGLIAKFAMTTDWDPGIIPLIRNHADETARMMSEGQWFGRRLSPYDPDADRLGLVPWAARAHRDRFRRCWDAT